MNVSAAVIEELADTWLLLHRSAAEVHLRSMISEMEQSGDTSGASAYRLILSAVDALRKGPSRIGRRARPDVDRLRRVREEIP